MRFAKIVFWIAAIWGFLVITPLLFMFEVIGKKDPPAITHPGFYYGFVTLCMAWQIAFVVMARDPVRLRPMIIPAVFEKYLYVVAATVLYLQARLKAPDMIFVVADAILGALFGVAWMKTKAASKAAVTSPGAP